MHPFFHAFQYSFFRFLTLSLCWPCISNDSPTLRLFYFPFSCSSSLLLSMITSATWFYDNIFYFISTFSLFVRSFILFISIKKKENKHFHLYHIYIRIGMAQITKSIFIEYEIERERTREKGNKKHVNWAIHQCKWQSFLLLSSFPCLFLFE